MTFAFMSVTTHLTQPISLNSMADTIEKSFREVPDEHLDPSADLELSARIQALPEELQHIILWFTDGFQIPAVVRIVTPRKIWPDGHNLSRLNQCYKPPVALQIDAKIRKAFARAYYSTTIFDFVVKCLWNFGPSHDQYLAERLVSTWFGSLNKAHRSMIRCLQVTDMLEDWDFLQEMHYHLLCGHICAKGVGLVRRSLVNVSEVDLDHMEMMVAFMACAEGVVSFDRNGVLEWPRLPKRVAYPLELNPA